MEGTLYRGTLCGKTHFEGDALSYDGWSGRLFGGRIRMETLCKGHFVGTRNFKGTLCLMTDYVADALLGDGVCRGTDYGGDAL